MHFSEMVLAMSDNFEVGFDWLPPELQVKLWILALDADTSKVNIQYTSGAFSKLTWGFSYSYGGAVEASLKAPQQSYKLGFDPGSRDLSAGGVFRGFRFNLSAATTQPKVGLSLGYGQALLPFPSELSTTFTNAHTGFGSVVGNIRAYPDNPLRWYDLKSDDKKAIGDAIAQASALAKHDRDTYRLGAGIKLNYSEQTGLLIMLGVQLSL